MVGWVHGYVCGHGPSSQLASSALLGRCRFIGYDLSHEVVFTALEDSCPPTRHKKTSASNASPFRGIRRIEGAQIQLTDPDVGAISSPAWLPSREEYEAEEDAVLALEFGVAALAGFDALSLAKAPDLDIDAADSSLARCLLRIAWNSSKVMDTILCYPCTRERLPRSVEPAPTSGIPHSLASRSLCVPRLPLCVFTITSTKEHILSRDVVPVSFDPGAAGYSLLLAL